MSAFGGKADIEIPGRDVCFLTQSGHERLGVAAVQTGPEPRFAGHKSLL
jgi:hypothetical protein